MAEAVDLVMRAMTTDKLKSYGSAKREIMPGVEHPQHKGLNNRPDCPNLRRHHRPGHRCLTGCPNPTRGARPNNLTVPSEPTHKTTWTFPNGFEIAREPGAGHGKHHPLGRGQRAASS